MRPLLLCAFTVFASLTTIAAAEELANGVYVLSWEGPGIEIRRADTYGKVFLGKQVGTKLRDDSI